MRPITTDCIEITHALWGEIIKKNKMVPDIITIRIIIIRIIIRNV